MDARSTPSGCLPPPGRLHSAQDAKVYEVDPLVCPRCGGQMRIIAFLTEFEVVDRIINHLELVFVATKPPPPSIASQELLLAAEASGEYFS